MITSSINRNKLDVKLSHFGSVAQWSHFKTVKESWNYSLDGNAVDEFLLSIDFVVTKAEETQKSPVAGYVFISYRQKIVVSH